MKYGRFLELLTTKEKMIFVMGAAIEKMGYKIEFPRLRKFRNMVVAAEQLGFGYSFKNDMLALKKDNIEISLRKKSSDYEVFGQVFIRDEYQPVISYVIDNGIQINTIVDAGSNIGLTAVKLINKFPQARIICLEPDPQNYVQLKYNLKKYSNNIIALPDALWYKEEDLFLDFGFRDGTDWSRSVSNDSSSSEIAIKGISLNTLIQRYSLDTIDLLKIDIEGSEATLFRNENDLSFLDKVKIIAIEIHDEFNCRQPIYDILNSKNYTIFNAGELTMGINKNYSLKS
jgi:FkbM family methyltransferase